MESGKRCDFPSHASKPWNEAVIVLEGEPRDFHRTTKESSNTSAHVRSRSRARESVVTVASCLGEISVREDFVGFCKGTGISNGRSNCGQGYRWFPRHDRFDDIHDAAIGFDRGSSLVHIFNFGAFAS